MVVLDSLYVLLAGAIFLGLYAVLESISPQGEDQKVSKGSKNLVLKYTFLFAGLTLLALSFFSNYQLGTISTSTAINGTVTSQYNYVPDTNNYAIGQGIGFILILVFIDFIWKIIKGIKA